MWLRHARSLHTRCLRHLLRLRMHCRRSLDLRVGALGNSIAIRHRRFENFALWTERFFNRSIHFQFESFHNFDHWLSLGARQLCLRTILRSSRIFEFTNRICDLASLSVGISAFYIRAINAGCNNRNANDTFKRLVINSTKNNIGIGIDFFTNTVCSLVDLEQCEIATACNRNQQAACTAH